VDKMIGFHVPFVGNERERDFPKKIIIRITLYINTLQKKKFF